MDRLVLGAWVERRTAAAVDRREASVEMKRALIVGIMGQDGSYLAEFLLQKGYEVHGTIRRVNTFDTERLDSSYQDAREAENGG